jgi:hypothetical protein
MRSARDERWHALEGTVSAGERQPAVGAAVRGPGGGAAGAFFAPFSHGLARRRQLVSLRLRVLLRVELLHEVHVVDVGPAVLHLLARRRRRAARAPGGPAGPRCRSRSCRPARGRTRAAGAPSCRALGALRDLGDRHPDLLAEVLALVGDLALRSTLLRTGVPLSRPASGRPCSPRPGSCRSRAAPAGNCSRLRRQRSRRGVRLSSPLSHGYFFSLPATLAAGFSSSSPARPSWPPRCTRPRSPPTGCPRAG